MNNYRAEKNSRDILKSSEIKDNIMNKWEPAAPKKSFKMTFRTSLSEQCSLQSWS